MRMDFFVLKNHVVQYYYKKSGGDSLRWNFFKNSESPPATYWLFYYELRRTFVNFDIKNSFPFG